VKDTATGEKNEEKGIPHFEGLAWQTWGMPAGEKRKKKNTRGRMKEIVLDLRGPGKKKKRNRSCAMNRPCKS